MLALPTLGSLWLAWGHSGLVAVEQRDSPRRAELRAEHLAAGRPDLEVPTIFREALQRFDAGEPIDLASVPVELSGPPFFVAVWTALRRVPRGHVRTYGGLAKDAGSPRATRAVGTAMARNPLPLVVPCHRVIASESHVGGYSDGLLRKRLLLGLEGVRIEGDRVLPGQLDLL